jgi:hypothetical protein
MKVTINPQFTRCTIERENSPKIYRESTLMYHIKQELQAQGYDVITKDLSKEPGNMLSPGCYGLIARNRDFQIYYPNYCIDNAFTHYNSNEPLTLFIHGDNPSWNSK